MDAKDLKFYLVVALIVVAWLMGAKVVRAADNSTSLELGIGITQLGARNGIWWQSDYQGYWYHNDLRGNSQIISLRVPNWRVSLVHMGQVSNSAMWGQYELDYEQSHPDLPRCDAGGKNECFYGHGHGDVWGASLGRVFDLQLRRVTLEAEGGAFLYQATWHEAGTGPDGNWYSDTNVAGGASDHGSGFSSETHITYYLGAGISYRMLFLQARYYGNVRNGNGLMGQMAKQVMGGIKIPFSSF